MPQDVKVDVQLLVIKPLHAKWVVEIYHHIQLSAGKKIVKNKFRKCNVKEAYDQEAIVIQNCAKNPFLELDIVVL